MRLKLLIVLLLLAFNNLYAQQDSIPVGSNSGGGSTNSPSNTYGPMMSNVGNAMWNRHAYIYPSSLYASLTNGTVLNAISFPRFTSSFSFGVLSGTVTFKIYLRNTSAADFGAGSVDWTNETSSATLVYNGNSADIISIVGNTYGIKKFPFINNFTYTGGNIEMLVEYTQSAAPTGEVVWNYDKTTSIAAYANNQVKYISGTGNTPTSGSLSISVSAHPAMLLYFNGNKCSGIPTAGKIPYYINACQGSYTVLNVSGYTAENGIRLKWQEASNPAGPWTSVTGGSTDTVPTYITANLYNTAYYRVKVTCAYTGDTAFTNIDTINVTHQPSALPLIMGFNSTTSQVECLGQDQVKDTTLIANPKAPSFVILSSLGNPTGTPTNIINPQEGDRMVKFNSSECDPFDAIRLKMPELSTKGIAGVDMYFWYYQINGHKASNDNIAVQYSLDNQSWTTVPGSLTYITNNTLDSTHNSWQKVFLSLPAAVGNKDSIWIALLYTSGNGYDILTDMVKVGPTGTLPVKYIDIKASKYGADNKISWTTYEEKDNHFFEIERSATGKEFVSIGTVNSKAINGNSISELNYNFTDYNSLKGNNYYRIKQTDKNGHTYYSEIVVVKQDKINALSIARVYPNPSIDGKINISIFAPEASTITATITDVAGKVIKQFTKLVIMGDNELTVNLTNIESGNYFIRTSNNQTQSNALMFEKR